MMIDKRRQRQIEMEMVDEPSTNVGRRTRTFSEKSQAMSELDMAFDMADSEGKFTGNRDNFREFYPKHNTIGSAPNSRKNSLVSRKASAMSNSMFPTDSPVVRRSSSHLVDE